MKKGKILFLISFFLLLSAVLISATDNFNIEVSLPDSYKSVSAGQEIWFTTKVINLGSQGRMDITLTYDVIDSNNNKVSSKSQTLAVETQASFVESILLPDNLSPGKYTLKVTLSPVGSSSGAQSQTSFDVIAKKIDTQTRKNIYIFFAILSGIALFIYIIIKSKPLFRKIMIRLEVHRIVKRKKI